MVGVAHDRQLTDRTRRWAATMEGFTGSDVVVTAHADSSAAIDPSSLGEPELGVVRTVREDREAHQNSVGLNSRAARSSTPLTNRPDSALP